MQKIQPRRQMITDYFDKGSPEWVEMIDTCRQITDNYIVHVCAALPGRRSTSS